MVAHLKMIISYVIFFLLTTPTLADDDHSVDLKLFGNNIIENYDGCRFALWQDNKDPYEDKFAYIFFAPFNDGEVLPGWMKIGKEVYELERKDEAGENGLFDAYQLYESPQNKIKLIMEINDFSTEGDVEFISDARVTVIETDKFPFRSRKLQGHLHCPANYESVDNGDSNAQYGELYGDAISLYGKRDHNSFNAVPAPIIRYIRSELSDCDLDNVPEYATSYKISDAMTLWELPCALYARNASSVFFTALNSNLDFFATLTAKAPPGLGQNDRFDILNATVNSKTATITSYDISTAEDCGIYETHQLRAVEGESIELVLTQYRDKPNCDGVNEAPENYPLIYQAR